MKNLKAKLEININEVLADIYDADNNQLNIYPAILNIQILKYSQFFFSTITPVL